MKKIYIVFLTAIFILLSILDSYAFIFGNDKIEVFDDDYITVKGFLGWSYTYLYLYKDDKNRVIYNTTGSATPGISLSYKNFGMSVSSSIYDSDSDDSSTFKLSKYYEIFLYHYTNKLCFDLFFQNHKGFTSNSFEDEYNRSDLELSVLSLNAFYVFSDDFSFKAAFHHQERQTKRDWSFLTMLTYNNINISSDYSLIPPSQQSSYSEFATFKGGNLSSLGICPGFAFTVPVYYFYVTASYFLGSGFIYKKVENETNNFSEKSTYLKSSFRLSIGYNGENVFWGYTYFNDVINTSPFFSPNDDSELNVQTLTSYNEIFVGYRF